MRPQIQFSRLGHLGKCNSAISQDILQMLSEAERPVNEMAHWPALLPASPGKLKRRCPYSFLLSRYQSEIKSKQKNETKTNLQ